MHLNDQTPWLSACSDLTSAIEQLHDYRRMSESEFLEAHAIACVHLRRADQSLQRLIDDGASEQSRAFHQQCITQLRAWMAPILAGDRTQFRLIAIRDAARLWLPDRRRLERSRLFEAA